MRIKPDILLISLLLYALFFSTQLFSQKDSKKSIDSAKAANPFLDYRKELKPLNLRLIDTSQGTSILNFKHIQKPLGFKSNVNNYFDPFNTNNKKVPNFMSKSKEVDSDILVKKHFNGKDISNVKLGSDFSLGTLQTKSTSVKIEVRDHSLVDGDRIRVYLNEKVLNSNIMLNGISYIINIELKPGYNRIDIEALNEGYSGPNTAELRVFDDKGYLLTERDWNILTGNLATLGIIKN